MTNLEISFLVLDVVLLLVVNMMMARKKEVIISSRHHGLYFLVIKLTSLLPAFFTGLQLYVFTFDFVGAMGNTMYHWVLYCYIGYLMIVGFMLFMEESQFNLFLVLSVVLLGYQCWMSYQLIDNHTIIQTMGQYMTETGFNPFTYGVGIGYSICALGPILSLLSYMTSIRYWKLNNKVSFTN